MFADNARCFGGVRLPRDVLEHCIVPAVLATQGETCWNRVEIRESQQPSFFSRVAEWIEWGLAVVL
jgi:hypothetical protein